MKSTLWKSLLQYAVGLGLLAYIIIPRWETKPGRVNDEQRAVTLVAGGSADLVAQDIGATPGLKDIFSRSFDPIPLIAATAIWTVAMLLTFVRWWVLVRAQGLPFTLRNAIRLGLVGFFFNTFLPGSVGGDIVKAVAVARSQNRRTVAVATIIFDRILGLWALALFVAIFGGFFWATDNIYLRGNRSLRVIVQLSIVLVVASAAVWFVMGFMSNSWSDRFRERLKKIPKLGGPLGEVWGACRLYRQKNGVIAMAIGMALIGHTMWVGIFHLCVVSLPEIKRASISEHMMIVPVGMTAQALFPLPGGVGGGEAAFGWLYTLLGKPAVGGIVGCLVQRLIAWCVGFVGYVVYTRMRHDIAAGNDDAGDPSAAIGNESLATPATPTDRESPSEPTASAVNGTTGGTGGATP